MDILAIKQFIPMIINPMLLHLIEKYKVDSNLTKTLVRLYNMRSLRQDYDFYSDDTTNPILYRGVLLLYEFFSLQLILKKDMYIPGVGLFSIEPEDFYPEYTFPESWFQIHVDDREFIKSIISEEGKLNYSNFNHRLFQVKKKKKRRSESFTFLSSNLSKIKSMNSFILENAKNKRVKVVLSKPYKGNGSWKSIIEDGKKHADNNIFQYISKIDTHEILYNPKILEDILYLIGYCENNPELLAETIEKKK